MARAAYHPDMLPLSLQSNEGIELAEMLPGRVQKAFGPAICPQDGMYFIAPIKYDFLSPTVPGRTHVDVQIARWADIVRTFVLKVHMPRLPDGARWKRRVPDMLFDHYELITGGSAFSTVSLIKNNAIARARDRWPTFNNNPDSVADPSKERWVVSIPLFPELVIPLIKLRWHMTSILLSNMFSKWGDLIDGPVGSDFEPEDFRIRLECEGAFLDRKPRAACANDDQVIVYNAPSVKYNVLMDKQEQIYGQRIDGGSTSCVLSPTFMGCVTHVVIAYTPDVALPANAHPLRHLVIRGNYRSVIGEYDHIDLEELNWLKCGLLSPMGELRGRSACSTFLYLVPFCADAFEEYPTTWLEAGRLMSLDFAMFSDRELPAGSVDFLAQNLAVRKYAAGMTGLKYLHQQRPPQQSCAQ